jgi:hypothetical protein
LLTKEEASAILDGSNEDAKNMLRGRKNTTQTNSAGIAYLYYWLGTSVGPLGGVWYWAGAGDGGFGGAVYYYTGSYIRGSPSFNGVYI